MSTIEDIDKKIEAVQKSTRVGISWLLPAHEFLRQKNRHYYNWHLNPHHKKVHWGITTVVMIMFVVSTFLSYFAGSLQVAQAADLSVTTDTTLTYAQGPTYNYDNVTISGSGVDLTLEGGVTLNISGYLNIDDSTGATSIVCQGRNTGAQVDGQWVGEGCTINVTGASSTVTVDASSSISANGQGYAGNTTSSKTGKGPGGAQGNSHGSGAAHAGTGGADNDGNAGSTTTYGTSTAPTSLGSEGGASLYSSGGDGGGAVRLNISGASSTLSLAGTISANGSNGASSGGVNSGAGSGGSIYITTATLSGSGTITANGGSGGTYGGGGGGGRIVVEYKTDSFTNETNTAANGGSGLASGTTGTVAFFDTSGSANSLYVYKTFKYETESATISLNNVTVTNAGTLSLAGGVTFNVAGNIDVDDSGGASTITCLGKNTAAQVGGVWVGAGCTINVTGTSSTVTVDATSSINANGQGYAGNSSSSKTGKGPGGAQGNSHGSGAAHAGTGGADNDSMAGSTVVYNTSTAPTDLGSEGGASLYVSGGDGGGAVRLNISGASSTLNLNGTISANGNNGSRSTGVDSGGGSGGSVWITTGTLTGSGTATVNGGNGSSTTPLYGGGGGGGRVAVYYLSRSSDTTTRTASGGSGKVAGTAGTTVFNSLATASLTSPSDGNSGMGTNGTLQSSVDDYDDRTDIVEQIQYKQYDSDPDCSGEAWTDSVTSTISRATDGTTTSGWSGGGISNGLFNVSGGAQSPVFAPTLTSAKYYCWRARSGSLNQDSYTKTLLHADGTDASTTFTDSSDYMHPITRYDNAQLDTAQSKFGGASGLFYSNGTNGDYLTIPDSDDWAFGTGNFTIDFWVRFAALPGVGSNKTIFAQSSDTNNLQSFILYNSAGTLAWQYAVRDTGTYTIVVQPNATVSINTWYHIALVRTGNDFMIFQDGTQVGSTVTDTSSVPNFTGALYIGRYSNLDTSFDFNGWLDEFRISKGIARWTANFTPYTSSYDDGVGVDTTAVSGWGNWTSAYQFLVNTRPAIGDGTNGGTAVTATQNGDGTVSIGYQIKDADSADTSQTVSVWMGNAAANSWELASGITSGAGTATVDDATGMPTSGTLMLVDADGTDTEEEATFTRSGNTLTLTARGQNTTTATAYSTNDDVYIKATTLSGNTGTVTGVTTSFVSKSATWTPKTDFDGTYLANAKVRVEANDGHAGAMNHGSDSSSFALDVKDPASVSISVAAGASYTNAATNTLTLAASDDSSLTMQFSNNNSTWSDYEAYGVSKSWDLTNATYGGNANEGSKTAYVRFKDAKSNTATANDAITYDPNNPTAPTSIGVLNFSISGSSLFRNILYWNTGADTYFRRYQVERSTNGTDYAQAGSDITDVNTTYYNDTGLTSTTSYYYRVKTEDYAANSVTTSATTRVRPAGANISTVSAGTPGATSATITWSSTTESNSIVEYKTSSCSGSFNDAANLDESVTSHSVGLSALSENTTYYYKVRSRDAGKLEATDDNSGNCYTFTSSSDVPTGSADINNAASYVKSGDETVTLRVGAADTSGYVAQMRFSNNGTDWSNYETYSATKTWDITNATYGGNTNDGAKTVYVKLKDNSNIESTASITDSITYDKTAPTVSAPGAVGNTNDTTPTWSWSAATDTNSVIDYQINLSTLSDCSDSLSGYPKWIGAATTSYTPVSGLSDGTYYACLKAKDTPGNTNSSWSSAGSVVVETVLPVSNSVAITDTNGYTNSATVNLTLASTNATNMRFSNDGATWTDWEAYGTSKTGWNLTSGYGGNSNQGEKKVYVQFKDGYGNIAGSVSDLTVYDTVAPTISSISESMGATGTTASITWTTNEVATTAIYYDTTARAVPGGAYTDYLSNSTDSNYDTNHRRDLSSLSTGTVYYYLLRAVDRAGNAGIYPTNFPTSEESFTTTTFPTASSISAGTPTISSTTITWTTNVNASSLLIYGATTGYGSGAGDANSSTTSHSTTISGLSKNTLYHYKIRSRDTNGNIVSDTDHSFTTADDAAAPSGTVNINNSATYTNNATVTLAVNATDTGEEGYVYQMKFSNNSTDWSSYETYAGTKSWDITNATYGGTTTNGTKTVYVKLKDNHTNETSATISDTISYDNVAPTTTAPSNISSTNSTKPTISWSAATDATSGVEGYYIKIGTTSGGTEDLAETWIGNVTSYTPITALSEGTHYTQIKAKDNAINTSSYTASATIAIDTTAPTSNSLTIADASDAGTTYTDNATVNLTLASTGASQMKFSNNGVNWTDYESYSTSKTSWNMTVGYGGSTSEGTKTVYTKFRDAGGNETDSITDTITYDATAPVSGAITIKDANEDDTTYSDSTTVDLTLSATDATSGMYQMRFSNDNITYGDWVSYATTYNDTWILSSGDGSKTVYVQYKDNAGNTSSAVSDSITLDTTGPTANTPTANSPTSNQKPTWSWTASTDTNGVQGYYVKIGTISGGNQTLGETWIGNNTSYTPTSDLTDGTYYLSVKAQDNVGNAGSYVSSTGIVIDTTTPSAGSISIAAGAAYTTSTSVTLTIAATNAVQMNISNDGVTWNGWEAYATSKSWTLAASEGLKTVYIKFKNAAGGESDSYTDTITYDATPVSISSLTDVVGSAGITATITWTTSDEATTAIYYGASSQVLYTGYPSSSTDSNYDTNHRRDLSGLSSNTKYYYMVRSIDRAGNATVSAEGDFTTVALPSLSSLAEGAITISTQVLTWSSNVSVTSIVELGTSTGSYTSSQGVTASRTTSHSVTVAGLASGQKYYYRLKGQDQYGNETTSTEGDFTTTADTTSPTGSVSGINNGAVYTNTATVNLAIAATDTGEGGYINQMSFSNNGTTWSDWEAYSGTKSWDITNTSYGGTTANGVKTVYVKVRDNSSNSSTSFTNTITYDNTAPTTTAPSNITSTNSTKPTISWSAATDATSGVEGYYIKIGTTSGGTEDLAETWIGNVTSYTPITALAEGTHYTQIKAKDNATNTSSYTASATIAIDVTAPTAGTISINSGATYANTNLTTLTLSATAATQMKFSNNGTNWSDYEAYATTKYNWDVTSGYGGSVVEGLRYVYVMYKDAAGNESAAYSDGIIYDGISPQSTSLTIKDASDSGEVYTDNATVALTLNARDENSGIYQMAFSNDGATYSTWESYATSKSWSLTDTNYGGVAADGSKTAYVKFKDNAGNISSAVSDTIALDTTGPSIAGNPSTTTPTNNTKPTFTWNTASDGTGVGVSGYYVKIGTTSGGAETLAETWIGNQTSYTPITAISAGTYYFSVKAQDSAGNSGTYKTSSAITLDTTAPTSGSITINSGASYSTSTAVTLAISASNATQMDTSNNGTTWDGWDTYSTSEVWSLTSGDATKTVYIKFRDAAGNVSDIYTDTIILDTTAPTISALDDSQVGATGGTAVVEWDTDEEATTAIYHGTTTQTVYTGYTLSSTSSDYDTNHRRDLSSLQTGTKYYYMVRSIDRAGNAQVSAEGDFTTTTYPLISNLAEGTTSHAQQVLTWTTNINSNSIVEFGASTGVYTDSYGDTVEAVTSHSVTVKGLTAGTTYYYRIKSRDANGNYATSSEGDFVTTSDTTPPTGSAIISSGVTYANSTTVNLAVAAVDTGGDSTQANVVTQMKFSNNGTTWSDYETYATTKSNWDLSNVTYGGNSNEGTKTIYLRLKDNSNVESTAAITDTIIYDNTAPTSNQPSVTTPTSDTTPTISWTASTDTISGIDHYNIKIGTTSGGTDIVNEVNIGNVTNYTPSLALTNGQTYYVSIKATDAAGKVGNYGTERSFAIDTAGPTSGSLAIKDSNEDDYTYTDSTSVTLVISATDAQEMNISNDNITWNGWENYATSKSWTLSSGDATKLVYIKFRDRATSGNESTTYSDSIILDTTAPTISSISESMGATGATASVTWTTNEVSTTAIYYDTTARAVPGGAYTDYLSNSTDSNYDTNHRRDLSSLSTGTVYYYLLRAVDRAGNAGIYPTNFPTSEESFTTTTFPTASSISAGTPTISSTTITWTSNIVATSVVSYGTTTSYGSSAGNAIATATSHSATISGLARNTLYHYKISSRDSNGNTLVDTDHSFTTADDTDVPTGTLLINGGDSYSTSGTINLAITANDSGQESYVTQVKFSNDGTSWTSYETFTGTKSWNMISGNGGTATEGSKTIYVKLKDNHDNESANITDTITYDASNPGANQPSVTSPTSDTTPTVSWVASTDAVSGIGHYGIKIGTTTGGTETAEITDIGNVISYTPTTALAEGTYYVSLRATDGAGNTGSYGTESSFTIDTTSPTGSISIDSAATYNNDAEGDVTLTLAYAGTPTQMRFSNNNSTWSSWESVATTKAWNLATDSGGFSTEGLRTVYVQYRDSVQNTSSSYSDQITWDKTAPTGASVIIKDANEDDSTYSDSTTVDLTLTARDENSGIYQMRFSNDNVTYGDWVSYATSYNDTWTLSSINGTKTVYAQYQDNAGNISTAASDSIILDTTAPTINTPSTTSPTANTKPTWSWTASTDVTTSVSKYYVKIGTTSGAADVLAATAIGNQTSYTPISALSQGTYYLSIMAEDLLGNQGDYTSSTGVIVDTTVPTGSINISSGASYATSTSVTLTLSGADTGGSTLSQMNFSNDNSTWNGWESYATSKSWTLSSTDGTKNVYVKFNDTAGNTSVVYSDQITLDTSTPTISSVSSSVTYSSATISWTTDQSGNSVVQYGTSSGSYTATETDADTDTNHRVILSSLSGGQTYYYRVKSTDAAGNEGISSEGSFTTVTYPVISTSSISESNLTNESITITWTTNVASDSYVEYGTTTSHGSVFGSDTDTTSHAVTLTGLDASQKYYYKVKSTTPYGDQDTGPQKTFTTASSATASSNITGVTKTGAATTDVITTQITINWSTTVSSSSYVEYGLTSSYGTEAGQNERVTSHSVTIEGLMANTTYHYRVKSIDKDGNIYVSADDTFTTGSSVTPSITEVAANDVGLYLATIFWKTSQTASTQVLYGTSSDNLDQSTTEDTSPNTTHTVKLSNLSQGTNYYYRVRSVDSTGNLLLSAVNTFSTITFPQVSEVAASFVNEVKATISWKTNVASDSTVEYGFDSNLGTQQGKSTLEASHSVELTSLQAAKTYYYRVKSRDIYGNLSTSSISSFTTKSDTTGPVISDIMTESSTVGSGETSRVQVIVSWSTDEPATSVVEYGTGLGTTNEKGEKAYENSTTEETKLNESHIIILTNLQPSTSYHFRVKSSDTNSNTSYSDDYTVLTPTKQESIIQIIVKSLEDTFGWIPKLKDLFSK